MKSRKIKSIAGNMMHVNAIGATLLFVLSCTASGADSITAAPLALVFGAPAAPLDDEENEEREPKEKRAKTDICV